MKYVNTRDLELWEIGLNDLHHNFYELLYNPLYDRLYCLEAESEFRGYYTALFFAGIISSSERDLLFNELQIMTHLSYTVKIR